MSKTFTTSSSGPLASVPNHSPSTDDLDRDWDPMGGVSDHKPEKLGMKDKIKAMFRDAFPEAIQDTNIMLGITALEARVKKEMQDPAIFPEVDRVATVRRGLDLCPEEKAFLARRKVRVRDHFAKYLGLEPEHVHPDDVPTVSFGGSGGGLRAMIACLGYGRQMRQSGLWDCLTYVSGVSGSCWSLAAYYTFGDADFDRVIDHCKKRFSPHHPLSGEAIRTILSAPGGARTTLGPLIQKSKSGLQTVAMDLYAVFTTGWIFFQHGPSPDPAGHADEELAGDQESWYRWSSAAKYTDTGAEPLPIMTAIRHERPWKDWKDKEQPFASEDPSSGDHANAQEAWFQFGCDEIEAWVPTWGFGRPFDGGTSTMQLPEQSLALLLGLCTSAPAGPLTSYISTIARNPPPGFLGSGIHKLASTISRLWGKQGTEEFQEHHPLQACNEHNFLPRIHLIDAGMDNNCPTYVLLHPSRAADVIITMDASSDVQKDTFPDRLDQIGSRRGLRFVKRHPDLRPSTTADDAKDPHRFDGLYAQLYDGMPCDPPATVIDSYGRRVPTPPAPRETAAGSGVAL
ncbi:cytosolic phospholipase A2 beta-like, partial [Teratosphaeria destructans]